MSYVIIDKIPVFISNSLEKELNIEFFGKYEPCLFSGFKDTADFHKAEYTILEQRYKANPMDFIKTHVYFDLQNNQAKSNVWLLLANYCQCFGFAHLSDIRNEEKLLDDSNTSFTSVECPMGAVFALDHTVKPYHWWWRISHSMKNRTVRTIISVRDIDRIIGTLSDFFIITKYIVIRCNRKFQIIPYGFAQKRLAENKTEFTVRDKNSMRLTIECIQI